ncbi:MAG TPA: anti-sigma factor antagonist [Planctomycetaceae bacterium]|jgi:anti-sigma B factor antagonist|nr:anti-sigma factor antagonist [Planctomycetaceae bacterium]
MLQIRTSRQSGVTVLSLEGQLIHGAEGRQLGSQINDLVARGETRILLDLTGVGFIDSSGISELVSGYSQVKRAGGDLKLSSPKPLIRQVFQVVKLTSRIEVCETLESGVAALNRPVDPVAE